MSKYTFTELKRKYIEKGNENMDTFLKAYEQIWLSLKLKLTWLRL